jgi:hypothetical protein
MSGNPMSAFDPKRTLAAHTGVVFAIGMKL